MLKITRKMVGFLSLAGGGLEKADGRNLDKRKCCLTAILLFPFIMLRGKEWPTGNSDVSVNLKLLTAAVGLRLCGFNKVGPALSPAGSNQ